MSTWCLTPVNARSHCKTRLSDVLNPETRWHLVEGMLGHVLDMARACPDVDVVAVVSPDSVKRPPGCLFIQDDGLGLNPALEAAASQAAAGGASRLIVVPADLPRLTVDDLVAMAQAPPNAVALAPDSSDCGTNSIAFQLPAPFDFHFGLNSLSRHVQAAKIAGLTAMYVRRPGLADLDHAADLALLQGCAWAQACGLDGLIYKIPSDSKTRRPFPC